MGKELDQSTVGCAGKLVSCWAAAFRLGDVVGVLMALLMNLSKMLIESQHLHSPMPLLKTSEALIENHKDHWEQLWLTCATGSDEQPLPV